MATDRTLSQALRRLDRRLAAVPERGVVQGINRATTRVRTAWSRRIRARYRLPAKFVNTRLRIVLRARKGAVAAEIVGGRYGLRARLFKPTQPRRGPGKGVGVRIRYLKSRPTVLPGRFIATMPSGYTGVFYRVGKGRLKIHEQYMERFSQLADAVADSSFQSEVDTLVATEVERAIANQLRRLGA